jgi:elongator complex protein 3
MVPLGERGEAWQHRGYGRELLRRAEETAAAAGYRKIAVISGVGAREYYRKLGYGRDGPYMSKLLG